MKNLHSSILLLILTCSGILTLEAGLSVQKSECPVTFSLKGIDKDSGKFINQLGFYHSCLNREGMTYYLASTQFLLGILKMTYIGVCAPISCTQADIQQSLTKLYKTLDVKYQGIIITNPKEGIENKKL